MTHADVALDGEGQREPHARVAGDVRELDDDGVTAGEQHRDDKHQVEDVVYGQSRQVVVGRRPHPLAGEDDDVDDVAEDTEGDDDGNKN